MTEIPVPPPNPPVEEHRKTEYEDPPEEFARKMTMLVELVRNAKHLVAYTGAGISTSAGIPDFRGDNGLDVKGWQGSVLGMGVGENVLDVMMPTYAHRALVALMNANALKFVVTSNHDNFHIRAGVPQQKISELFGNAYIETCLACRTKYLRSVWVPQLGRTCDDAACGGRLKKEGVRFNAMVPAKPLRRATKQSKKADVALVLGSSLTVSPFCELPFAADKAVVCTLQDTSYDDRATLKINARCDDVMRHLLHALGMRAEPFVYRQGFRIAHQLVRDEPTSAEGVDDERGRGSFLKLMLIGGKANEPCTCVDEVRVAVVNGGEAERPEEEAKAMEKNVLRGYFDMVMPVPTAQRRAPVLSIRVEFRKGYGAPAMQIEYVAEGERGEESYEFVKEVHYE